MWAPAARASAAKRPFTAWAIANNLGKSLICPLRPRMATVASRAWPSGPLGGRGLGKRLVRAAMQDVIASGETVSSSCWFASALIEKVPEWSAVQA